MTRSAAIRSAVAAFALSISSHQTDLADSSELDGCCFDDLRNFIYSVIILPTGISDLLVNHGSYAYASDSPQTRWIFRHLTCKAPPVRPISLIIATFTIETSFLYRK
jgi:hypothetical protein